MDKMRDLREPKDTDPQDPAPDRPGSLAGRLAERPPAPIRVPRRTLQRQTRRDFLLFGAGAALTAAGFWWLLPDETRARPVSPEHAAALDSLEARLGLTAARKDRLLNRTLTLDDDVAEALFSPDRRVPTYSVAQVTPNLRNNYEGDTPDPDYLSDWTLTLSGLESGRTEHLTPRDLLFAARRWSFASQITRLVCVEGWSAIAWWGGLRFSDFLEAYPPRGDARWVSLRSDVNLDLSGNSDPYYVSLDLDTARHPQTLLAMHQNGAPLTVEHGAPLRLVAPMKLGLKNIKAITHITYRTDEPPDYWNERGYSKYDGL